jgi:hypothetical protein
VAEEGAPAQRVVTVIPAFGDPDLLPLLEAHDVEIKSLPEAKAGPFDWLIGLLPWGPSTG